MIPRKNRLKHMKDFEILFKEGRFVAGELVNMKIWAVLPEKYPKRAYSKDDLKIGFVVSTKVHKSAVKRNRINRQMREIIRLILREDKLKNGYMAAIMAKGNILGKDYKEIEVSVKDVLNSANILKKD